MKEVKKIKTILKFSFLIVALALFGNVVYRAVVKAATGAPAIVSYQGRLTDSSGALLGGSGTNYFFKFSIWDNSTVGSGSKLWPSGSPGIATSTVTEGVFNVNIGDISNNFPDALDYNFNDNDTVFLQVEVSSNGSSFETLSPRQQIASTGFAINANTLKGFLPSQSASGNQIPVLNSGNLILGGTNPQLNATGTNALVLQGGGGTGDIRFFSSANNINTDGELTIAGTLTIGSYVADPSGLSNGTIFYNSTSNKFKIVENGTTKILCNTTDAGCGAGGGSPTWSSIIDPTGNLALIMASTTSTFTWGSDTGSNNLFNFNDTTGNTGTGTLVSVTTASGSTVNPFRVSAAGINSIYVNSSGNVGFGTTTPTAKVSIVGLAGNNNVFSLASSTGSTLLTVSPAGTVTINNNLSVSGQTNLGNASTTALTVSGVSVLATTSATALTVNTINGNILTSGSGTVTLNSNTLTLSGSATLNQDLRTSDSPTFAGLTINGSQTISGTLGVTGTSTLATTTLVGRLSVSGSTTLSSLGTGLVRSSSGGLYTDIATYLQAADLANYSTYAYGSSTYVNFGYATNTFATLLNTPSYTYASSTFATVANLLSYPTFTYGSSTYVNFGYASNTFATLLNTPSYTYASSTFPSFSYASTTYATAANLLSYPTFTYGSSTYVNYGYASNTFATLLNTPTFTYGSSTYVNYGYATNTFATLLNTPSYTYTSSTFPSFTYGSSTYATAANLLSYPTFTYGSSTYVNFGYATNTFATLLNTPSYTYGSSTYATAANLLNYPTFTYGSSTYVNFGYATNTFATLLNTPSYTYASSTFPSFSYASSTFQPAGSYLTSALTSLSNLSGPAIHVATTSDTNIQISISTTTANTLTFIPSFTGTLAASRLNSNVVQGVTNDTNVTGSITAQNLTLGWTGQLSVARGGTGVGTLTPNAILLGNGISNIATVATSTILRILQSNGGGAPTFVDIASLLTAGSNIVVSGTSTIAVSDTPSFTSLSTTGNLSVGGSLSVTATTTLSSATTTINGITYYWPNSQAVGVKVLQNDGNGNLSWVADQAGGGGTLSGGTIGFVMVWASSTGATVGTLRDNGTVAGVNATSSTVTFNIQGTAGDINPFCCSFFYRSSSLYHCPKWQYNHC